MRIVIDMQGAQGNSRNRGIGRYTLSLVMGMVRCATQHEFILLCNGAFGKDVEEIRAMFCSLLPAKNIRVWMPSGSAGFLAYGNGFERATSELLQEASIANLKPDVVLVTSLFEGLDNDCVTSIGQHQVAAPVAVIFYDLIPMLYPDKYLRDPVRKQWYENKLSFLRKADAHLAISESSRQESITHLGTPPNEVFNISSAADDRFCVQDIPLDTETALRHRYNVVRPFVMYTGGSDFRKNIDSLIAAFALLPAELAVRYQLVVVCAMEPVEKARLSALADKQGLAPGQLVLTGFVPDTDLLAFYNLCEVFVFPSLHEGFGLPALEAMSCGKAVIGSNRSSLPEVIGSVAALFDPYDNHDIADKLRKVLSDEDFRRGLEQQGLERAKQFSWAKSAEQAINALEKCRVEWLDRELHHALPDTLQEKPKMAFVSPLPPERTGIADYSACLLPELSRYYDIDVIADQENISDPWVLEHCTKKSSDTFLAHAQQYDRVLYHLGNSSFHQPILKLLREVPGVVVLHDFFLSGLLYFMEHRGAQPGVLMDALYASHGYDAVRMMFTDDAKQVTWRYPCNLPFLQQASGVICHSNFSRKLAATWYGETAGEDWCVLPLVRKPVWVEAAERRQVRSELGLSDDQFLVCSFGLIGRNKLNHRLLDVWLASPFAKDLRCVLVFVGENDTTDYGARLLDNIAANRCGDRIKITGWASQEQFSRYLLAADAAVQLRGLSLGEVSAAVLDCMNYGVATIVNANGGMVDLPSDAVWKLSDDFTDAQLMEALATLYQDAERRCSLGARAQKFIQAEHNPEICARRYAEAIERTYRRPAATLPALLDEITDLCDRHKPSDDQLRALAVAIDHSLPATPAQSQLFVDVTALVKGDVDVTQARNMHVILSQYFQSPPHGYRIEPIYIKSEASGYYFARSFTMQLLGCPDGVLMDEPVHYKAGDRLVCLDLYDSFAPAKERVVAAMHLAGVGMHFFVYEQSLSELPQGWFDTMHKFDGAVCVSPAVADKLRALVDRRHEGEATRFVVEVFQPSANFSSSIEAVHD